MSQTLLLNATFEPIKVISWERAVTLFFQGKVDVVEEYDEEIRGVSMSIQKPSVVRLKTYARQERRVRFSRENVFRRDKYKCMYCGCIGTAKTLTMDHVVPRSKGGKTSWDNIVSCCRPCNAKKAAKTPEEAKMKLHGPPHTPSKMSVGAFVPTSHESWEPYLGV
jgi:5-methylcytosine-specific restriction endonuclease McrA